MEWRRKGITLLSVNPEPRTYVRGFGILPCGEVRNIHHVPTVLAGNQLSFDDGVGMGFIPGITFGAFCGSG